jgi:predicted DNA-binding transcriptional regulator AlpA
MLRRGSIPSLRSNIINLMNKTAQHKKALLEALEQSLGVVTSACKKVGIGRTTFYLWMNDDEEFKKQVDDISNVALDFAESQLHKQIKEGVPASTIFFLKTKGKSRGYIEKSEISMENKVTVSSIKFEDA